MSNPPDKVTLYPSMGPHWSTAKPRGVVGTEYVLASKLDRRWIPVAERLPTGKTRVLAWVPDAEIPCGGFVYALGYHESYGWSSAGPLPGEITHWMPLPEPPK